MADARPRGTARWWAQHYRNGTARVASSVWCPTGSAERFSADSNFTTATVWSPAEVLPNSEAATDWDRTLGQHPAYAPSIHADDRQLPRPRSHSVNAVFIAV